MEIGIGIAIFAALLILNAILFIRSRRHAAALRIEREKAEALWLGRVLNGHRNPRWS